MQNSFVFVVIVLLFTLVWVSERILTKKYNIKQEKGLYAHVNRLHKWGEALIIAIALVLLFIHSFILDITGPLKPHHFLLALFLISIYRIFMEFMHERGSKRYLRTMLYTVFILILFVGLEFAYFNPVPVRLEVDQVKEITIESYSETEEVHTITLTDEDLIKPILNTIGEGEYQRGAYPIEPRLKMIIKHSSSREIIIKESIYRNGVFMLFTDRILFPRVMTLLSQDLQLIFEDIGDKLAKQE